MGSLCHFGRTLRFYEVGGEVGGEQCIWQVPADVCRYTGVSSRGLVGNSRGCLEEFDLLSLRVIA